MNQASTTSLDKFTTNDKTITRALGTIITIQETRDIMDIDGDGAVSESDVTALLDILENKMDECDVNGDGHTTNSDALS